MNETLKAILDERAELRGRVADLERDLEDARTFNRHIQELIDLKDNAIEKLNFALARAQSREKTAHPTASQDGTAGMVEFEAPPMPSWAGTLTPGLRARGGE